MNNQPTREKLYSQSKGYGFSPALERTRKPFAVRNILTLAGLLTFTGSVYAYSLFAVKQDDFSDVKLPNALPGVHDVTNEEKKN
ncbi:hypothetical protein G6F46_003541 [Rhizopus delemar]|uniref:Cytochrome c oxidase assembly factor 3 n=3 Tax=Rhizopus TaxID=4842 RepID=I1CS89_RHIO9|nr:hypothetical protein RO3G_16030 [Rhizopus delemar RA 99-880]KAG1053134.1 hypothetical protein G6F43_004772 [Rhizopus delemar]KAG1141261.1 hypothetical protein G6F38_008548 [Rhizopus arrhizus]KAG1155557.1 hypothetical protein G6F37_008434 [Rhizopus arrhizus]KAG1465291.1 hypothetical protein G6F55_001226 [Rhizopus delemar]|eukprot:EIE91319.1 hypothetical protein RO3G_16030 [Rhizopus delemar RA 99-880]